MGGHLHLLPGLPLRERKILLAFPKWQKPAAEVTLQLPGNLPFFAMAFVIGRPDLADPAMTNICWLSPALTDYSLLGVCVSPMSEPRFFLNRFADMHGIKHPALP